MLLTARALLFNLVFYTWTLILAFIALAMALASTALVRWMSRFWSRTSLVLLRAIVGLDYEVRGREFLPAEPFVAAVKHQSAWDILAMVHLLPSGVIVAKQELSWIPLFGYEVRRADYLFIDRGGGAAALRRLVTEARGRAESGYTVIVYPQGTRTLPGAHRPYQSGVAALYTGLDLPVVPVALNSGLFWPRRRPAQRPGVVTVEFLPPIPPGQERHLFMVTLENTIEAATTRLENEARERFLLA